MIVLTLAQKRTNIQLHNQSSNGHTGMKCTINDIDRADSRTSICKGNRGWLPVGFSCWDPASGSVRASRPLGRTPDRPPTAALAGSAPSGANCPLASVHGPKTPTSPAWSSCAPLDCRCSSDVSCRSPWSPSRGTRRPSSLRSSAGRTPWCPCGRATPEGRSCTSCRSSSAGSGRWSYCRAGCWGREGRGSTRASPAPPPGSRRRSTTSRRGSCARVRAWGRPRVAGGERRPSGSARCPSGRRARCRGSRRGSRDSAAPAAPCSRTSTQDTRGNCRILSWRPPGISPSLPSASTASTACQWASRLCQTICPLRGCFLSTVALILLWISSRGNQHRVNMRWRCISLPSFYASEHCAATCCSAHSLSHSYLQLSQYCRPVEIYSVTSLLLNKVLLLLLKLYPTVTCPCVRFYAQSLEH